MNNKKKNKNIIQKIKYKKYKTQKIQNKIENIKRKN